MADIRVRNISCITVLKSRNSLFECKHDLIGLTVLLHFLSVEKHSDSLTHSLTHHSLTHSLTHFLLAVLEADTSKHLWYGRLHLDSPCALAWRRYALVSTGVSEWVSEWVNDGVGPCNHYITASLHYVMLSEWVISSLVVVVCSYVMQAEEPLAVLGPGPAPGSRWVSEGVSEGVREWGRGCVVRV